MHAIGLFIQSSFVLRPYEVPAPAGTSYKVLLSHQIQSCQYSRPHPQCKDDRVPTSTLGFPSIATDKVSQHSPYL